MKDHKADDCTVLLAGDTQHGGGYGSTDTPASHHNTNKPADPNGQASSSAGLSSVLSFHDINYLVKTKVNRKSVDKPILKNISGVFEPGMNAILGPTGSGKTSLLDILAMRKNPRGLSGTVLINGSLAPSDFRLISGYVVQDDIVMGTLTVRENLMFSASVHLGGSVAIRAQRVQEVIDELGLGDCAETKIGNAYIRGVSGGERKRTNIGMELIVRPHVLFLDEPTTGLDASTANAVIMLLASLSKRGCNIILSIHQPRYSIYRMFDTLHLLSKGETVYHGRKSHALQYFSSIGYKCGEHNNPSDFFLDVINGDSFALNADMDGTEALEGEVVETPVIPAAQLGSHFEKTETYTVLKQRADAIYDKFANAETGIQYNLTYPVSFPKQLYYVCGRAARNILRNPKSSYMQFIVIAFIALIVGGLYWQIDKSATSGIQNRVGAFFFVVTNMIFGNISAVEVFVAERVIFIHESASGFYRVSAYFLAKVFCDLLPMRIVPTFVFSIITYWMIGFRPDAASSFIYALTLMSTSVAASSLALLLGACFNILAIANLFIALSFVFMMIFGGLLINIASLPNWLQYLQYLSVIRFAMNALSINELRDEEFCDPPTDNGTQSCLSGNTYLETQGIDYTWWGLWQNIVGLAAMTVIFLTLTYIRMRVIPKFK